MRRRPLLGAFALAPVLATAGRAQPRWSPDRPVRFLVPFPAGGATDVWARITADAMAAELGQPVVIENRSGASGLVGTEAAAKAAPDGHTLLFTITTHVQAPVVLRRWPYRIEDFAPIGRMGTTSLPFVVRADVPARTLADFTDWARGRDLSFGSYATGSTGHAMAQLLSDTRDLGMTHVAYRGEAPMLTDLLGGRIVCGFHSMTAAGDPIRSGRIRPLASLGRRRIPSLPAVPTFLDLGYPEPFAFTGFVGLLAPARTPAAALARHAEAFRAAMLAPAMVQRLEAIDVLPEYLGPAEFQADIEAVLARWTALVTQMNLSAEG